MGKQMCLHLLMSQIELCKLDGVASFSSGMLEANCLKGRACGRCQGHPGFLSLVSLNAAGVLAALRKVSLFEVPFPLIPLPNECSRGNARAHAQVERVSFQSP